MRLRHLVITTAACLATAAPAFPAAAAASVTSSAPPGTTAAPRAVGAAQPACGSTPVVFRDRTWCPAHVFEVNRRLFPVGTRLEVGAVVTAVSGRAVTVAGGPSCYPDEYCGPLVPSMTVTFRDGARTPAHGDVVQLFGRATATGFAPAGFVVVGRCDPVMGDC